MSDRDDSDTQDEARENERKDAKDDGDKAKDKARKKPGKKPLIILGVVVVVLAIGAFVWWFLTRNQVSTDDAYTDGDAVTIAPKVSGYVVTMNIDDNRFVHKGDLLIRIDPRDYQAQLDQANAQLGLAQAQLHAAQTQLEVARVQYPAQLAEAQAQELNARANLAQASAAYERQHSVDIRATSQQNIDTADAQQKSAQANVAQARAQVRTASLVPQQIAQVVATVEERRQQVRQAQAQVESAQLNLSYTELRAPADGWITKRNVQYGTFLQAGTSILSLVTTRVWISANFKESQLDRMQPGDKVDIDVDAYPDMKLHGHVDSVQLGSGSRFSAFPAENATGNFVKIVQRVPVKIVIDDGLKPGTSLPLGLSVVPTVMLRH
ncbi:MULTISPECIES: HlyD family secretion protein [Caballeronia]|uniref:EmrA n=1 Tax=Caballeronia zhejiangensis TaxID=871203 RepID=A0A656QFK8_9BURK|nr:MULTISPECIES: HlyD family secretion protein [Caballeronia]EKS70501.1 major facilitator superfamily efflux pump membrane fusion protein [Burkholderia sp. SJ98]KDR28967.1 EmrA [Caballeronia zhejiangensis]MDR5767948.1 HlyD family secretion protein [Caballeronia sp. LZ028]MDR5791022.1 HlyD family secretion protein [Caballeronia sp. LP003]